MINANELRKGNKILSCFKNIETIFAIHDNTNRGEFNQKGYEHLILVEENGNQYKPFEVSPVPITDKLLLKAKFRKTTLTLGTAPFQWEQKVWKKDSFWFKINDDGSFTYDWNSGNVPLKYMHHLQNIYFYLLMREL